MAHADSGGVRIFYEITEGRGDDPRTVVLVQGLGLSSRFWFEQPELLAADPRGPRRIIVLDNRGTGRSDRPTGPYNMRMLARDVVAVLDAAGCERATLVGVSMGGMIAQRVAMHHPDRVDGLVLLATLPGLPHSRLPSARTLGLLLSMPLQNKSRTSRAHNRLLLPEKELDRAAHHFAKWPAAIAHDPLRARTFASQFAAIATNWTGDLHKHIACPTMIVSGAEDILVPPDNGRRLAARIKHSRYELLADVAHAVPLLDRDVVARSLRSLAEMAASIAAGEVAARGL